MYIFFKRIFDFIFALLLLILLIPIIGIILIVIKLDSKGPVLFKQKRPGKYLNIFTMYKFRTMRIELDENGVELSDICRITRVGMFLRKTSLDELPQLINILRGEMSFIGPRPLLVDYLPLYSFEEMRRHDVTPGISGLAQVNGRNTIDWKEKFKYDLWYVDNQSFFLDMKILFITIYCVCSRKGINNSKKETMPTFKGK
ncbi:MAG: sugar transferase [Eubacteriaceae bacterium]